MIERSIDVRSRDIIRPSSKSRGATRARAREKTSAATDLEESQIDHFNNHYHQYSLKNNRTTSRLHTSFFIAARRNEIEIKPSAVTPLVISMDKNIPVDCNGLLMVQKFDDDL
jgi:hypothetical protein